MAQLKITELEIPEIKIIEPTYFEDFRGYYCETYSKRTMAQYGFDIEFVQDNHSLSLKKGTVRGIHFQLNPKAQLKLVRCVRGRVMDYAVDLRKGSPTYKKWVAVELSEENRKQILIPAGFGHAFISLVDNCEVQYKVDELYYPEYDRAIAYNDPEINIDWGIDNPVISQKDTVAPTLSQSDVNFIYEDNK
ncbi:MAG: dTDP-4-dehydrorhamnose 3,5-epimerase [Acutalibacteraceae bacterium]|nr:dTDP-4-dehydrorhamnose 3,5-epimerase [Acutalibacteraceae bacterium]